MSDSSCRLATSSTLPVHNLIRRILTVSACAFWNLSLWSSLATKLRDVVCEQREIKSDIFRCAGRTLLGGGLTFRTLADFSRLKLSAQGQWKSAVPFCSKLQRRMEFFGPVAAEVEVQRVGSPSCTTSSPVTQLVAHRRAGAARSAAPARCNMF